MIARHRIGAAAALICTAVVVVLGSGPGLAHEEDLSVVATNGRVVVANGQPGCAVTVTSDGFAAAAGTNADGVAVLDAALPDGAAVSAAVAGAGCAAEQAIGVVDNDQQLAEAAAAARTGADTVMGLIAAVGAVGIGTVLVISARRKKA